MRGVLAEAGDADIVVKASGVGVFDRELLEGMVAQGATGRAAHLLGCRCRRHAGRDARRSRPSGAAPRLPESRHGADLWRRPAGGRCLSRLRRAPRASPIYNALDPDDAFPGARPIQRFACDLAFLGNRLPDREARVEEFFLKPAARAARAAAS